MSALGHIGPKPGSTIEQDFWAAHRKNPHIYRELVRLAREWRQRHPDRKVGIKCLFETARWHLHMRMEGEPVAMNNSYTALYARLIMEREPDLEGLFETRALRAAEPFDGRLFSEVAA